MRNTKADSDSYSRVTASSFSSLLVPTRRRRSALPRVGSHVEDFVKSPAWQVVLALGRLSWQVVLAHVIFLAHVEEKEEEYHMQRIPCSTGKNIATAHRGCQDMFAVKRRALSLIRRAAFCYDCCFHTHDVVDVTSFSAPLDVVETNCCFHTRG